MLRLDIMRVSPFDLSKSCDELLVLPERIEPSFGNLILKRIDEILTWDTNQIKRKFLRFVFFLLLN